MVRIRNLILAELADSFHEANSAETKVKNAETKEDREEQEAYDRVTKFVGQYVVTFQQLEAELDQIILLLVGHEKWHFGTKIVSCLPLSEKIELIHSTVASSKLRAGSDFQQRWLKEFEEVFSELRNENSRRNKIVHSLYLFDFARVGAPVLRSKRSKKKPPQELDQEFVDEKYFRKALGKVSELCFDVGMVRRQLIPWTEDATANR